MMAAALVPTISVVTLDRPFSLELRVWVSSGIAVVLMCRGGTS